VTFENINSMTHTHTQHSVAVNYQLENSMGFNVRYITKLNEINPIINNYSLYA